ncbi:MAG: MerR family DNA-binding transcriptional regulator [Clostridiales bacterium]|jgi:DNA-binding transcriptional MerR regulator|nr:MerR family DNA-binding transcriptional regulator [Clostridiales bacterium]
MFYSIGEVSKLTGVPISTLRYYADDIIGLD